MTITRTGPMLPAETFAGRTVVVTGGGSGIGAAIARYLAALGAHVVLVGRRPDVLAEVVSDIIAAGASATACPGDVRDREVVEQTVAHIEETVGSIDHLVNSAAGNFRAKPEDLSPNAWRAVVDIVLHGTWNWTQITGQRAIEQQRPASVVSIGTVGAFRGGPTTVHSATAKAGVATMTQSLAAAWGQYGIRLNVVTPGPIADTPGTVRLVPSGEENMVAQNLPLKRFGTEEEVADAVAYLLSDYAGFITGANLVVDGGSTLLQ